MLLLLFCYSSVAILITFKKRSYVLAPTKQCYCSRMFHSAIFGETHGFRSCQIITLRVSIVLSGPAMTEVRLGLCQVRHR